MLRQIVDGFSYNTSLLYQMGRYWPNALAQIDVLRRAANYKARWFVVPDDQNQPIAPFDTLYYQLECAPGSYLWGYHFSAISATGPDEEPVEVSENDLLVNVVDSCTGIPLFMDFASGAGLNSNFSARMVPIMLSQARLILDPGLVNVEISNRTENEYICQLLLHFAEPCKLITEEERARQWVAMSRV